MFFSFPLTLSSIVQVVERLAVGAFGASFSALASVVYKIELGIFFYFLMNILLLNYRGWFLTTYVRLDTCRRLSIHKTVCL